MPASLLGQRDIGLPGVAAVEAPFRFPVAHHDHRLPQDSPQPVRKSMCEAPPLISISNRFVAEVYPGLCCWKSPPKLPCDEPLIVTALTPPLTVTRHSEWAGACNVTGAARDGDHDRSLRAGKLAIELVGATGYVQL